jgi:hypothetical protein
MIGYSDLKFKKNKMYHFNVDTKVELVPHKDYENMFYIYFGAPDSIAGMTADFYNKTHAIDNAKRSYTSAMNNTTEDTTLEVPNLGLGSSLVRLNEKEVLG